MQILAPIPCNLHGSKSHWIQWGLLLTTHSQDLPETNEGSFTWVAFLNRNNNCIQMDCWRSGTLKIKWRQGTLFVSGLKSSQTHAFIKSLTLWLGWERRDILIHRGEQSNVSNSVGATRGNLPVQEINGNWTLILTIASCIRIFSAATTRPVREAWHPSFNPQLSNSKRASLFLQEN